MIVWNEDYATGVETVDQQHRMLILHINRLEEVLKNTKPTAPEIQIAPDVVAFLEQYANTHFKFEDQCMASYRCPAHALNQQQHGQFIEFFERFNRKFQAEGFSVEAFEDLYKMTSAWITSHILRVDAQLLPCVQASRPN